METYFRQICFGALQAQRPLVSPPHVAHRPAVKLHPGRFNCGPRSTGICLRGPVPKDLSLWGLGRPPDRVLKGTGLSAACGQGPVCRPPASGLEGELRSLRSLIDSKPGREASVNTESLKAAKPQGYNQGTPSPSAGGPKTGHCWLTLGVVFGWTLGWCACGLRCPVNPSSLGGGRSFAQDLFRLGLSSRAALCGTRSFGEPLCTTGLFNRAGGGDGEERREEGEESPGAGVALCRPRRASFFGISCQKSCTPADKTGDLVLQLSVSEAPCRPTSPCGHPRSGATS